jgi:hypothetical protein
MRTLMPWRASQVVKAWVAIGLARHEAREQPLCRAAVGVDREATLRLGLYGQVLEEGGQPGWK